MWGTIAVIIIIIVILIVSLVYASRASTQISSVKDFDKDKNLEQASRYLIGVSVVGWLAVILLFVGLIALFSYGGEAEAAVSIGSEEAAAFSQFSPNNPISQAVNTTANTILYSILAIVGIFTLILGIVTALAATQIGESKLYKSGATGPVETAYRFSVISAVAAIVSVVLIFFAYIGYAYYSTPTVVSHHQVNTNVYPAGYSPYPPGYPPPYQQPPYQQPPYQQPPYQQPPYQQPPYQQPPVIPGYQYFSPRFPINRGVAYRPPYAVRYPVRTR